MGREYFLLRGWCVQREHREGQAWCIQGTGSRQFVKEDVSGECCGVLRSEDEELALKEETKRALVVNIMGSGNRWSDSNLFEKWC